MEGLLPPIPPEEPYNPFVSNVKSELKKHTSFASSFIVYRQVIANDKGFKIEQCKPEQYKNSFFVRTAVDRNHFDNSIVHAETILGFKTLRKCY